MNDAVVAPVWCGVNLLLVWTAYRLSRSLFPQDGPWTMVVHVVTLCWACIVGVTLVLGAGQLLTAPLLLAAVAGVCAVTLGILLRSGQTSEPPGATSLQSNASLASRQPNAWYAVWGLLAAFGIGRVVIDGWGQFPTDWDSLAYHIPLVNHWLQDRTLYVPDCAFWYCPGNNEILALWFVAPFSGDFLVALNNVPATILLAAAAFQLAAMCGVSRALCHLAALAVVSVGPVVRQLVTVENDVAVAALFLATLVYGLRFARDRTMGNALLGGVAVGLLAGVKYYALGYAAAAGAAVLWLLVVRRRTGDAWKATAIGVAGVAIFGAYWYVRNTWATGAPLYPLGFTESTDLWREMRPASHTSTLLASDRLEVWPMLLEAIAAVAGPLQWTVTVLLFATLLWLGVSSVLDPGDRHTSGVLRAWLLVAVVLAALVYVITPNVVETRLGTLNMLTMQYHSVRFGLAFYSVATLATVVVLDDITRRLLYRGTGAGWTNGAGRPSVGGTVGDRPQQRGDRQQQRGDRPQQRGDRQQRRGAGNRWWAPYAILARGLRCVVVGALLGAVGYQLVLHGHEHFSLDGILIGLNVLFGTVLLFLLLTARFSWRPAALGVLILVALAGAAWGCQALATRWHRDFTEHYEGFYNASVFGQAARLDASRERIMICDYRYYPFFGSRRQFRVTQPLWIGEESDLLDKVADREVTILVIRNVDSTPQGRYDPVRRAVVEHEARFELLHRDSRYSLYRVRDAIQAHERSYR